MVNALTGLNDFKTEIDYLDVYYKWKTVPKDLKKYNILNTTVHNLEKKIFDASETTSIQINKI